MDEPPISPRDARNLTFLRRLVTLLTAVMIAGVLTIIVLLVIRLQSVAPPLPLPDAITLPDGLRAEAFTQGRDWYAVVAGDRILIFERASGALRQEIEIVAP